MAAPGVSPRALSEPLLEAGGTSSRGPASPVDSEPTPQPPRRRGLTRLRWLFAWCGGSAARGSSGGGGDGERAARRRSRRARSGGARRAPGQQREPRPHHARSGARRQRSAGAAGAPAKAPSLSSRGEPACFASIVSGAGRGRGGGAPCLGRAHPPMARRRAALTAPRRRRRSGAADDDWHDTQDAFSVGSGDDGAQQGAAAGRARAGQPRGGKLPPPLEARAPPAHPRRVPVRCLIRNPLCLNRPPAPSARQARARPRCAPSRRRPVAAPRSRAAAATPGPTRPAAARAAASAAAAPTAKRTAAAAATAATAGTAPARGPARRLARAS
jgi:hypothetical protein